MDSCVIESNNNQKVSFYAFALAGTLFKVHHLSPKAGVIVSTGCKLYNQEKITKQ